MGATNTALFTRRQNETATLLKALAHPARIAIVEYLLATKACICGDIVNHLPLAQATVSQHLRELKEAGLIRGAIEGTAICYCLDAKAFQKIKLYFSVFTKKLDVRNNSCC